MKKKVILGMSGGVDSTVAAKLLIDEGYEVIGLFMNCKSDKLPTTINWDNEEKILKSICLKLNIRLIIKYSGENYEKKVISKMFNDYAINLTPNPDILCNIVGKFPLLFKIMQEEKADFIATGHYAKLVNKNNGIELLRAFDESKDQSYFLLGLKNKFLKKCLFPLGNLTKEEVRLIAKKNNFENWNKESSKGVCYLGKINFNNFLKTRISKKEGKIYDSNNELIGNHQGSFYFTIGQRMSYTDGVILNNIGKKLYGRSKLYVANKKNNNIYVAEKDDKKLKINLIKIKGLHVINKNEEIINKNFNARIRHLGNLHKGKLIKEKRAYYFKFNNFVEGVASGQIIVLYKKDKIVAGGEMRRI
jgi:tRNA-uridine 2-sulfurtransferase